MTALEAIGKTQSSTTRSDDVTTEVIDVDERVTEAVALAGKARLALMEISRAEIAWDVAVSCAVPDRARRIGVHVRVDGRDRVLDRVAVAPACGGDDGVPQTRHRPLLPR